MTTLPSYDTKILPQAIGLRGVIEFINYSDLYVQVRTYEPGFAGYTFDMLINKKRSWATPVREFVQLDSPTASLSTAQTDLISISQIGLNDPNIFPEIVFYFRSVSTPAFSSKEDLIKILNGWFNGAGVPISVNGGTVVDPLYGINFIEGANINIVVAGNLTTNQTDVTISSAGGGSFSYTPVAVNTTPYAVVPNTGWYMYLVDATAGAITMNFPTAVGNNAVYTVKKVDNSANTVILTPNGAETIDGLATQTIRFQNTSVDLYSDNANLYIM